MHEFRIVQNLSFCKTRVRLEKLNTSQPGEDPEFPVGGGADPGAPTYDFAKISKKNCIKFRTFWAIGGSPLAAWLC